MKKVGIGIAALALALAAAFWAFGRKNSVAEAEVYTVTPQTAVRTIRCSGIVEAGEQKTVVPLAPCVVKEIYVQNGGTVKKGEKLFRVDLQATRERLLFSGQVSEKKYTAMAAQPTVFAPFDGIVLKIGVSEGDVADPARNGIVLADTSTLRIAVKVPEMRLKDVYIGQNATVCGECFHKEAYAGTVTFLSSSAGTVVGRGTVIDATVTLSDGEADDSLRLGLTAEVDLPAEVFEQCLLIPYDCLQSDEEGDYVLVWEKGTAVRRAVTVKAELSGGAVINEGLAEGELLLRHAENFAEGQAVRRK